MNELGYDSGMIVMFKRKKRLIETISGSTSSLKG